LAFGTAAETALLTASGAARAAGGGKAGLGALTDQTALEFRQCEKPATLRGRRVERFGQAAPS